ncbi:hypothetical protein P168DRAFT_187997 [Aspergillus campestris IBT 28561]|uniref:Uncharacterized protein n=1 Tax=Aspergillus campestris (strain IBT 28561) TaxID=1392248 RepID=A0A2I1CYD6_ASPC2|nr:uncharacterized protein P168DRAFT_187997 [Aspergillus campestris IBT 28561]PKY02631.1 hypothetical protein P168DRAFT_187997 [Aspergillus campestris IBT 28561]
MGLRAYCERLPIAVVCFFFFFLLSTEIWMAFFLFLFYPSISQVKIYDACTNYRSFLFFSLLSRSDAKEWVRGGGWWVG